MSFVDLNGIATRYEQVGSGPALLMFSPGGFDSSLDNWTSFGRYADLRFVEHLSKSYTCILFDRRESGQSGGRVERLTWEKYVEQASALLDHLGVDRAHVMGGCVGCSTAAALAIREPGRIASMVLFSPAGGARYRRAQHERFLRHLGFVAEHGLAEVVALATRTSHGFSKDPRVGPWAAPIRNDASFAEQYAAIDPRRYQTIVAATAQLLFDRDTVPGPEPDDLLTLGVPALIVPGQDTSHAPSAAHYLHECLPDSELWDVPVAEQTSANTPARVLEFLDKH